MGILAIALLSYSLLESTTRFGTKPALIQMKTDISDFLDPAWTVNFFRNIILFSIAIIIAKPVSILFNEPRAVIFTIVIGFVFLIRSFGNVAVVYFQKD